MSRELVLDDLRIGMYITVIKVHKKYLKLRYEGYAGDVFQVVGINYPFISAIIKTDKSLKVILDLRSIDIINLNREYIKSLCSEEGMEPDSFWDNVDLSELKEIDKDIEVITKAVS